MKIYLLMYVYKCSTFKLYLCPTNDKQKNKNKIHRIMITLDGTTIVLCMMENDFVEWNNF